MNLEKHSVKSNKLMVRKNRDKKSKDIGNKLCGDCRVFNPLASKTTIQSPFAKT